MSGGVGRVWGASMGHDADADVDRWLVAACRARGDNAPLIGRMLVGQVWGMPPTHSPHEMSTVSSGCCLQGKAGGS
eukprot:200147-Chlamydomonas_euryale.AAC.1